MQAWVGFFLSEFGAVMTFGNSRCKLEDMRLREVGMCIMRAILNRT